VTRTTSTGVGAQTTQQRRRATSLELHIIEVDTTITEENLTDRVISGGLRL